jgi:hypothetical protein
MKQLLLYLASFMVFQPLNAQDIDSLNNRIAELRGEIKALESEVAKTQGLIPPSYGWRKGFAGTVGLNATSLDNWVVNANPNSRATTLQGAFSGFTNLIEEKYFWRNAAIVNLGWQRLQIDKNSDEGSEFQPIADVFQVNSLFGWNLTPKLAISAMGELRTTLIRNSFDPGYIDLGAGITWTPIPNLVAVFHPLNYNIIIASEEKMFESSLGTKFMVDYAQEVFKGIKFVSNLTGFASYKELGELSNVTWTNRFAFTVFKGIGVGIDYALRWSPQETRDIDTDLQRLFLVGLSYSL